MTAFPEPIQIGKNPLGVQQWRDLHDKGQLDISAREAVVHEPLDTLQSAIHIAEVSIEFLIDSRLQRGPAIWQAAGVHALHQRQHGTALGVMQPLQVSLVGRGTSLRKQAPIAVMAQDIVNNRARLNDCGVTIREHR